MNDTNYIDYIDEYEQRWTKTERYIALHDENRRLWAITQALQHEGEALAEKINEAIEENARLRSIILKHERHSAFPIKDSQGR